VHGLVTGNAKRGRINLIMAQRRGEWLAPMLFKGSCTHRTVTAWVKDMLIKELYPNSLIIMDNAPFHNKADIKEILQQHGHNLLPLPKYSPDFNPIEQTFAIIKRIRQFKNQCLDKILGGNYKLD
jgi:transposase